MMLMATYTTPLRAIIEQPTQHRNDLTLDQRIEVGRVVLFDFDYPMFDDRYKKVFEKNFINNFYDREIGFETEHLFKRRLQNWLNINMGYYSELMRSETLKFDPFINSEMNVTHKKTNDETSQSDKNFGETTSRDVTDSTITDEDTTKFTERDSTINTTDTTDRDSTVNTQNDGTTNTVGETSGKSSGTNKTTGNTKTDTTSSGTTENDDFKRDLHTDTPDTRLAITTADGEGSIGYASNIDESTANNKQKTSGTGNETTNTTSDSATTDTTSTNSSQNETTSETGLSKELTGIDETGQSIEDTDISEIGRRDETIDRIINDLGKRDFDEKTDGTINSIEDFVQHRYGKIGVQTYSKMLMEYRQTFLRIEREIFDEMNQLFMLVY